MWKRLWVAAFACCLLGCSGCALTPKDSVWRKATSAPAGGDGVDRLPEAWQHPEGAVIPKPPAMR